jgi:hypothetical protein
MAESSIDVMMKVVSQKGPVLAESNTVFKRSATPDPLRLGFNPGQVCDLLSFEFAAGVEPAGKKFGEGEFDEEEIKKEVARQAAKLAREQSKPKRADTHIIDMQPIRFTRIFDMASPIARPPTRRTPGRPTSGWTSPRCCSPNSSGRTRSTMSRKPAASSIAS